MRHLPQWVRTAIGIAMLVGMGWAMIHYTWYIVAASLAGWAIYRLATVGRKK